MLRITFDTNVLDLACRPDRFPKHALQPGLDRVKGALSSGRIQGFYPVTMLTIEGIMRTDRADVFSGTRLVEEPTPTVADGTVELRLRVEQPGRKPLHPEVIARATAAQRLRVRALKPVPRIGAFKIEDPDGTFYAPLSPGQSLGDWIDRTHEVMRAIEARGVGMAQVKALGVALADPADAWFSALNTAPDIHAQRAIERAFSEWADAEALASHIAYGFDVFCSEDVGNSNATNSILDAPNRTWLTATYGTRFMTFEELHNQL